jgi:hypothetical protein
MVPVGYMAKRVRERPTWLKAPQVKDVYSLGCVSEDFADYINFWRHNGYWLFDSPEIINNVAEENSISLKGTSLFYCEMHEMEFDGKSWCSFRPEPSLPTNVTIPTLKKLEGFDVVTSYGRGCSPLSCNGLAQDFETNEHCLIRSFKEAEDGLNNGELLKGEPGPYRILSVNSVEWS